MTLATKNVVILVLLVGLVIPGCTVSSPVLSAEEQRIIIEMGDQETTLTLMHSHTIIGTGKFASEQDARRHAIAAGASVAQMMLVSQSNGKASYTFRFWKPRDQ
jgi:hypothetical protein